MKRQKSNKISNTSIPKILDENVWDIFNFGSPGFKFLYVHCVYHLRLEDEKGRGASFFLHTMGGVPL